MSVQPEGELHSWTAASSLPPASDAPLPPLVLLDGLELLSLDAEFEPEVDPELEPELKFELWLLEVPEGRPASVDGAVVAA